MEHCKPPGRITGSVDRFCDTQMILHRGLNTQKNGMIPILLSIIATGRLMIGICVLRTVSLGDFVVVGAAQRVLTCTKRVEPTAHLGCVV